MNRDMVPAGLEAARKALAENGDSAPIDEWIALCVRAYLDASSAPQPDLAYLLEAVETHADKFPVPSHMRQLVDRVRSALIAPSLETEELAAEITAIDEYGPCLDWHKHWADIGVGAKLYLRTKP